MNTNSERDDHETLSAVPAADRRAWIEPAVTEFDLNLAEQATIAA